MAVLLLGQKSAHSVWTHLSHSSHMIHSLPSSLKSKQICLQYKQKDYFSYWRRQSAHRLSMLFQWERLYLLGLQAWQILLLQMLGLGLDFGRFYLGDLCSLEEGEELGSGQLGDSSLSCQIYSEMRALKFILMINYQWWNFINAMPLNNRHHLSILKGLHFHMILEHSLCYLFNVWLQMNIIIEMIVLKRLQSFARSCTGTHFFYAFSSAKPVIDRLSNAGQQAVWANQIIKLIKNEDSYPLKQTDPTILDKIKNLNVPKTTRLEPAFYNNDGRYVNRDEVVKMMTEGIVLNPIVFAQQRVQNAKQQKKIHSDSMKGQKFIYSGNFIFYPNYLGTSCMFNELDSRLQSNFLLTGGFGISKTISIIFYIHLSNFITNYAVQCSKNPQLQKQLDLLKQENLLQQPFLKYFYWSADYEPTENSIQEVVVEQAVELQEKDKKELLSIKQWSKFITRLRQMYPSTIQIRPIVDQFNLIASLMRRWNCYLLIYQINKKNGKKELSESQQDHLTTFKSKTYQRAKSLSTDLYRFLDLGPIFGLNSSLSIQKDLFDFKVPPPTSKDTLQKIGFELGKLLMIRMPYERQLEKDKGKVDSRNTTWFEIWRRLKHASPETVAAIRKNYLAALTNKNASNFFRFVYLRGYLDTVEPSLSLNKLKPSISTQQFKQILREYPKYCLQKEKSIFMKMFQKIDPWCKDLMLIMHKQAQVSAKNQQQVNKLAVFKLQKFKNIASVHKIDIQTKLVEVITNQAGQPFPFHLEDESIKLNWTFLQFYQLTTYYLFPNVAQTIFKGHSSYVNEHLRKGTARGCSLQTAIMESLTPGSILQYNEQSGDPKSLKIAGRVGFIPFNHNLTINKNVSDKDKFKKNFNDLLTICYIYQDSNFFAKPQYKEKGILRTSQTSKGIDFVIGKYRSKDKKYLIRTFDTTVEESPSQKVKEFNKQLFPMLSMLAKKGGYTEKDIEFQHIIPSLKQSFKRTKSQRKKNGFQSTLIETNVSKLTVLNSANKEATNALSLTLLQCQTILSERKMIERQNKDQND